MAGLRCSICDNPQRKAIDAALATSSLRAIAGQFGVTRSAIQRHKAAHLSPAVARAAKAREESSALGTLDSIENLLSEALSLLGSAKAQGKIGDATKAIREAHALLATRGRLLGEFPKDGSVVNIDARRQIVNLGALTIEELRSLAQLNTSKKPAPVAIEGEFTETTGGESC